MSTVPTSVFRPISFIKSFVKSCLVIVLAVLSLAMPVAGFANTALTDTAPKSEMPMPQDSFGRDTPRSTMQNFVKALSDKDMELTAKYLDSDFLKKQKTPDAVIHDLKLALDKGGRLLPDLSISDKSEGDLADRLLSNLEKVGTIDVDDDKIDLLLIRKTDKDNVVYWQIYKETLDNLPKDLTENRTTLADAFGLDFFGDRQLLGHKISDVVSLIILIAIGLSLLWGGLWAGWGVFAFLYPKVRGKPFGIPSKALLPLAVVILASMLPEMMVQMAVPVTLRSAVTRGIEVVAWLATAWLALRVIDAVFMRAEDNSRKHRRLEQVSILNLFRKVAKAFMLILAVIIIFGNLGFDLTTGIAALGVGGLALAFGAQKTIENLIGSVMVVADRPVRVGDYCRFGAMEGTVIDIGIRSSRIRTLSRTIVTVPNGEFSAMQIENYDARDMFYFYHFLYLKRTANPDEIGRLINDLQLFLENHVYVNNEWTLVRLSELRQDAFVVEMRCYLDASDVTVFWKKQSELLIDVLNEVARYDVEHALPSQEIKIKKDSEFGEFDELANP